MNTAPPIRLQWLSAWLLTVVMLAPCAAASPENPTCIEDASYLELLEDDGANDELTEARQRGLTLWQQEHCRAAALTPVHASQRQALDNILASIAENDAAEDGEGLLSRFLDWLKERLESDEEATAPDWLVEFLENLDAQQIEVIAEWVMLISIAVLLLMLAGIVINEVRAARRQRYSSDWRPGVQSGDSLAGAGRPLTLASALSLPPQQRPAALLRLVIDSLIGRQDLPEDRSLTNHEMHQLLHQRNPDSAGHFARLCRIAEDALYGGQKPDLRQLDEAESLTRGLLSNPHKAVAA